MKSDHAELENGGAPPSAGREPSEAPSRGGMTTRELATAGAELAALSGFALAQPLFDLLSRNAEFFAVRGSTSGDIVLFSLALVLLPPLILLTVEVLAALVHPRLRLALHLLFLAGFSGLFTVQALKRIDGLGSSAIVVGTALAMAIVAAAYLRLRAVRRVLTILGPASLVFLALFLFFSPVTKLVFPPDPEIASAATGPETGAPPIVFVVFDEFPVTAMMTADGRIDAFRYPNLAAFARESSWFRNATSVSYETVKAVPALLTGIRPDDGLLPVFADHPRNLFTLLREEYRLNVHEARTHLCDRNVCEGGTARESFAVRMKSLFSDIGVLYAHVVAPPRYERRLPSVATDWGDFLGDDDGGPDTKWEGKLNEWKIFLDSVRATRRPTLNFAHVMLPHEPWEFLPSCRSNVYRLVRRHTPGLPPGAQRWDDDQWLVTQAHQRLLLQTQCVDALVGQLVRHLRQIGVYDNSLVILASDHGVSVRPGELRRQIDPASPTNLADIAFTILLVKRPGQERGDIIDHHVETIDLVPSISEIAGVPIPWPVDGQPLWNERTGATKVTVLAERGLVTAPIEQLTRRRDALVQRQVSLFGQRDDDHGLFGIGPHPELIGQRVVDLRVEASIGLKATIAAEVKRLLANLAPGSPVAPTPIYGSLQGEGAERRLAIAIAVNGRIAAVAWTDGDGSDKYSAMVPEDVFRPGENLVEVFAIKDGRGGIALAKLR